MGDVGRYVLGGIGAIVGGIIGYLVPGLGTVTGAMYGFSIGYGVGSIMFPPDVQHPGPQQLQVNTAQYASSIPVIRGRRKVSGNLLMYFNFKGWEDEVGGKGKSGGGIITNYTVTLVWGLCLGGSDTQLLKVWKGKDEIPIIFYPEGSFEWFPLGTGIRFHNGTQTEPDPCIAAGEFSQQSIWGVPNGVRGTTAFPRTPVWKGLAYVVMENFPLGSSAFIPTFTFEVESGGASDLPPTDIIEYFLTDDFAGLGLPTSVLDTAANDVTRQYCIDNDLLVAMVFDRQMSVLDLMQNVIAHHNGYIQYMGKIAHKQLMVEEALGTITEGLLVHEDDEYPITLSKNLGKSIHNKVTLQYTKRAGEYVSGTAVADDIVDIDDSGVRDVTVKLEGLTTYERATKMANLLLFKDRNQPRVLNFKLGPNMIGVEPGMVFYMDCPSLDIYQVKVRIGSVGESDSYHVIAMAQEEFDEAYDYIVSGADTSMPGTSPNFITPPTNVTNPVVVELPARYVRNNTLAFGYGPGNTDSWMGAAVYYAYGDGLSYSKLTEPVSGCSVTGKVIAFTNNTIDIELDLDATLASATSMDELITDIYMNVFIIRHLNDTFFCKFQNADLIGTRQWRLSKVIFGLDTIPRFGYGIVGLAINDIFVLYNNVRIANLLEADTFRTLYFKIASYNAAGLTQSLADCDVLSEYVDGLYNLPLPPCNIKVNDIGLQDDLIGKISANLDVTFTWRSRNRYCNGQYVYNDSSQIYKDPDFVQYRLEVYVSNVLKAIYTLTSESWTYTVAMQTTDTANNSTFVLVIKQVNTSRTSNPATITVQRG